MYTQQFPRIQALNIDDFMSHFGFEYPTESANLPFLEAEWWEFELSRKKALHRKKVIRETFAVFEEARAALRERYFEWKQKYSRLYLAHDSQKRLEAYIPQLETALTRPLEKYTWDRRNRCYRHKGAQNLHLAQSQLRDAKREIARLLKISDAPPTVGDDVTRTWHNFKLQCEMVAQDMAVTKKPKKQKQWERKDWKINVKVEGDSLVFDPQQVKNCLNEVAASDNVIFFAGTVNVGLVRAWLQEFNSPVTLHLTEKGFELAASQCRYVAEFYTSEITPEKDHTLQFA